MFSVDVLPRQRNRSIATFPPYFWSRRGKSISLMCRPDGSQSPTQRRSVPDPRRGFLGHVMHNVCRAVPCIAEGHAEFV
jgi:hypothetical protein